MQSCYYTVAIWKYVNAEFVTKVFCCQYFAQMPHPPSYSSTSIHSYVVAVALYDLTVIVAMTTDG